MAEDKFVGAEIIDGIRYYTMDRVDGSRVAYPSVTSVMSILPEPKGLIWWQNNNPDHDEIRRERAMIGSTCHYHLECLLAEGLPNHTPELEDIEWEFLNSRTSKVIKDINEKLDKIVRDDHEWEPEFLEYPIWSHDRNIGGRVDYVGKLDGVPCILDLKTSKRFHPPENGIDRHALQLAAYQHGVEYRTGRKIDQLYILRVNENNRPQLKVIEPDWDGFLYLRERFKHRTGY